MHFFQYSFVDFLGIENFFYQVLLIKILILGFVMLEDSLNFSRRKIIDPFLETFVVHELKKENVRCLIIEVF